MWIDRLRKIQKITYPTSLYNCHTKIPSRKVLAQLLSIRNSDKTFRAGGKIFALIRLIDEAFRAEFVMLSESEF